MVEYPPYVNAYGKLAKLFEQIRVAAVPTKFNQDFLETILGFKSSSDRPFIAFLKRLGFVDQANVPTQSYKDYRDESLSRKVLADQVRIAYSQLFEANDYAYKLDKDKLTSTLKRILGVGEDDNMVPSVVGTFTTLVALSDFEGTTPKAKKEQPKREVEVEVEDTNVQPSSIQRIGLSYTIVLNLPATTDIEVFNAIFKSLKENVLIEK